MKPIPPVIESALNATGLPWEIKQGSKHYQIRISNRLVGILPRNGFSEPRTIKNCIAQIRKAARGEAWSAYHSAQR